MARVFRSHQLVDEFDPQTHIATALETGELVIVQHHADGRPAEIVKRYPPGAWHAAGAAIYCGFGAGEHDRSCGNCHEAPVEAVTAQQQAEAAKLEGDGPGDSQVQRDDAGGHGEPAGAAADAP